MLLDLCWWIGWWLVLLSLISCSMISLFGGSLFALLLSVCGYIAEFLSFCWVAGCVDLRLRFLFVVY